MRPWYCLLFVMAVQPAYAGSSEPPYYGPMKAWHGIGFKFGVKHDIEKDGSWRVVASTRGGEAIDMAMYRAAELAREQGARYIAFLGGTASRSPGINSATVYARPNQDASSPSGCRSNRRGACYTADVAEVLRILGGPGGRQPGVAIVDHYDEYGRAVTISGFGVGLASLQPRQPISSAARPVPAATIALRSASLPATGRTAPNDRAADPASKYEQALKAARPVRGREPKQGWTISD